MATLEIEILEDWHGAAVKMRGHWGTPGLREVSAALVEAGFTRCMPKGTYYTQQEWRGKAADLVPVLREACRDRLSNTAKPNAVALGDEDMSSDEVLAEIDEIANDAK